MPADPRCSTQSESSSTATSLIQSARLNGHDPYEYLKDVLTRPPMQRASEIDELLPHRWTPV
nr:transposase domain-containing protein [Pseudomonas hormoni]